ncbi:MAG: DUF6655 family protein [Pirellulaceae bacterium]|nr:DUF6655 family protein [Pirellulaceae bacterium]
MNRTYLRRGAFLLAVTLVGCASMKESDTARTGLEQLLISSAVDDSLNKVDFSPVSGAKVFLKADYLESVDKNYILVSMRSRLLSHGCTLVDKADEADVCMEVASGGVGTDRTELSVGSPAISLGPMGSLPKISIYERKRAMGTAKLCVLATDTKTNQPVMNSGYTLARSDHQHWTMMGAGPVLSGSVAKQLESNTGRSENMIPSTMPMRMSNSSSNVR